MIYCTAELGWEGGQRTSAWFGVAVADGQEQVGASGATARKDASHALEIWSVVAMMLHYLCSVEYDLSGKPNQNNPWLS